MVVMPSSLLDGADLVAERDADLGVERGERLVEEEELRPGGEGAGEGDALLLAAGELEGVAGAEVGEADDAEHLGDAGVGVGAWAVPAMRRPKATFCATVRLGKSA